MPAKSLFEPVTLPGAAPALPPGDYVASLTEERKVGEAIAQSYPTEVFLPSTPHDEPLAEWELELIGRGTCANCALPIEVENFKTEQDFHRVKHQPAVWVHVVNKQRFCDPNLGNLSMKEWASQLAEELMVGVPRGESQWRLRPELAVAEVVSTVIWPNHRDPEELKMHEGVEVVLDKPGDFPGLDGGGCGRIVAVDERTSPHPFWVQWEKHDRAVPHSREELVRITRALETAGDGGPEPVKEVFE